MSTTSLFFARMTSNQIQALELKRLLHELKDQRPDICIRFRLIGEMWQPTFFRVVALTDNGVALFDSLSNEIAMIKDLREVVQFEIDGKYQNFHPHDHYDINSPLNIKERHAYSRR
jgi:hypothetical protein